MRKERKSVNGVSDNQLNTAEWLGAIVRYLWCWGKKEFKYFYNAKQLIKNALIGWGVQVVFMIIVIGLLFIYNKSI